MNKIHNFIFVIAKLAYEGYLSCITNTVFVQGRDWTMWVKERSWRKDRQVTTTVVTVLVQKKSYCVARSGSNDLFYCEGVFIICWNDSFTNPQACVKQIRKAVLYKVRKYDSRVQNGIASTSESNRGLVVAIKARESLCCMLRTPWNSFSTCSSEIGWAQPEILCMKIIAEA